MYWIITNVYEYDVYLAVPWYTYFACNFYIYIYESAYQQQSNTIPSHFSNFESHLWYKRYLTRNWVMRHTYNNKIPRAKLFYLYIHKSFNAQITEMYMKNVHTRWIIFLYKDFTNENIMTQQQQQHIVYSSLFYEYTHCATLWTTMKGCWTPQVAKFKSIL